MTAEATYLKDPDVVQFVAAAAYTAGQMVRLPDGRAGVITGLKGFVSGETAAARVRGQFTVAKTATMVLLDGQRLYWDVANNKAKYSGDYVIGVAVGDAASADTTCVVDLNVEPNPVIALDKGAWEKDETLGLGVAQTGPVQVLAFDAVAEVALAALYSADVIDIDAGPILEAEFAIFDIGNDAALDINVGLVDDTHATDFDAISEYIALHLDGSALDILAQSTDGTTTVAATDTTVDAVDDTYLLLQIDLRDKTVPKIYINGVRVLAATDFSMAEYAGNLRAIAHVEKTNNDTTAEVRVKSMHVRSAIAA